MQPTNRDIERFDRQSSGYEAWLSQGVLFNNVHRAVLASIPADFKPETILDIGCGTGRLLRKLAVRWPEAQLIGIDPAEGMIAVARRLTPGVTFYQSMAEKMPLPDASADLVTSTVSFHHWQDQAQGVCEVARVLRPGGYFVLADISVPLGLWKYSGDGHQASPAQVRQMFSQAGLTIKVQRRALAVFVLITVGEKT